MANRILTPSNVPNLFGLGLPGFGDDPNPMLATAFDASWCNGIQEEIIRIIEYGVTNGIGVPPNGAIFDQVLTVLRSFPFDGNPTFTQIVIAGMASLELGLDVTGPGDVTAALFNGVGESAITAVNASAQPTTITVNTGTGRAQFSQNNDPTSCTAVYENLGAGCTFKATNNGAMATVELTNNSGGAGLLVNGSVILGIDVTTPVESKGVLAMSEGGTVAAAKDLTLVGAASVTGTTTSVITAGVFEAIDQTGTIRPGIIDFYSQSGPPPTLNGQMSWGGNNNLTIGGSGGAARLVAIPVEEYLPGPVATVNGIDDTGLSIVRTLGAGDVVYVELEFESKNSVAGNDINVRIEIDAVIFGGTEQYRAFAADRVQSISRILKFTAPAAANYTFVGRHGASAGTTTSTNLRLTIRQANDFA